MAHWFDGVRTHIGGQRACRYPDVSTDADERDPPLGDEATRESDRRAQPVRSLGNGQQLIRDQRVLYAIALGSSNDGGLLLAVGSSTAVLTQPGRWRRWTQLRKVTPGSRAWLVIRMRGGCARCAWSAGHGGQASSNFIDPLPMRPVILPRHTAAHL